MNLQHFYQKSKRWKISINLVLIFISIVLACVSIELISYFLPFNEKLMHPRREPKLITRLQEFYNGNWNDVWFITNDLREKEKQKEKEKETLKNHVISAFKKETFPIKYLKLHPYFKSTHRPNTKYRMTQQVNLSSILKVNNFDVEFTCNSEGFRDYNHNLNQSKRRILVMGDSHAWGWGVEQDNLFSHYLETLLNARLNKKIEVVNIASPGWSPAQYLIAWELLNKDYDPEILILLLYEGNDLGELYSAELFSDFWPVFRLDKSGKLIYPRLPPPSKEQWNQARERALQDTKKIKFYPYKDDLPKKILAKVINENKGDEAKIATKGLKDWLLENSLIYYKFSRLIHSCDWLESIAVSVHLAHRNISNNKNEHDVDVYNLTKEVMREIHRKVTSGRKRLICLVIPRRPEISSGKETSTYYKKILRELQIEQVPLFGKFRKQYKKGKSLFVKYDGHLGQAGHHLSAMLTADYLSKN